MFWKRRKNSSSKSADRKSKEAPLSRKNGFTRKAEKEERMIPGDTSIEGNISRNTYHSKTRFDEHMGRYIGETVTIFVKSGGISGLGFTGILMRVNDGYIQLLTGIGTEPACVLGNTCRHYLMDKSYLGRQFSYKLTHQSGCCIDNSLGSVTYIPVFWIAAFVHNGV